MSTNAGTDDRYLHGCLGVIVVVLLACVGSGLATTWVRITRPSEMESCAEMCSPDKVERFARGDCFCVVEDDSQTGDTIDE